MTPFPWGRASAFGCARCSSIHRLAAGRQHLAGEERPPVPLSSPSCRHRHRPSLIGGSGRRRAVRAPSRRWELWYFARGSCHPPFGIRPARFRAGPRAVRRRAASSVQTASGRERVAGLTMRATRTAGQDGKQSAHDRFVSRRRSAQLVSIATRPQLAEQSVDVGQLRPSVAFRPNIRGGQTKSAGPCSNRARLAAGARSSGPGSTPRMRLRAAVDTPRVLRHDFEHSLERTLRASPSRSVPASTAISVELRRRVRRPLEAEPFKPRHQSALAVDGSIRPGSESIVALRSP